MAKNDLRKKVLTLRKSLSINEVEEKSTLVLSNLLTLAAYQYAGTLMTYVDFQNEVGTKKLIDESLKRDKRVAVPFTDVANCRLIPSLLQHSWTELVPGTWGILEPAPDRLHPLKPEDLDLVVVPGIAFDFKGNRLGYGGGFYDRFLPQTRPDTVILALAFEFQIYPEICNRPHDYRMHFVVTEKRIIKCGLLKK
ncbi:MAG TPA: 5-formyltetrahydrofolate cyclo-ligase [Desulfotomaculum sp.]|nr:5-formyltetrahydrofolate cyclo-ligase [Desulfotomaculum sp.]